MGGSIAIYVELEDAGNHHHRLGPIAVLEHCKAECLDAVDEQPAANALLVLDNPVSVAIPANLELPMSQARYCRRRFGLFHVMSPFLMISRSSSFFDACT